MRGRTRKISPRVIDFVIADITLRHPGKALRWKLAAFEVDLIIALCAAAVVADSRARIDR
jgi:hypothetical protein